MLVEPGQKVEEGETLIIMEAMKMEVGCFKVVIFIQCLLSRQ